MSVASPLRVLACGVLALLGVVGPLTACGDGRPAFCDDLARAADMDALSAALRAQDLDKARRAAREFSDLADGAPSEVRPDLQDLARAVSGIVDLLGAERNAMPGAGREGQGDAAVVERQRDDLNERLDELATTSSRVERWATRECGISLG